MEKGEKAKLTVCPKDDIVGIVGTYGTGDGPFLVKYSGLNQNGSPYLSFHTPHDSYGFKFSTWSKKVPYHLDKDKIIRQWGHPMGEFLLKVIELSEEKIILDYLGHVVKHG